MKNPALVKKMVRTAGVALHLTLCLGLPALSWAGTGSGTTGAEFLKVGVGARALGMGGAAVALTDDAHAYYWNPAGAATIDASRIDATYNNLYQGTNQGFIGYVHPMAYGVLGVSVDYLQVGDIERRLGDTSRADYTFTSKDSALGLSYSQTALVPGLGFGATLKYLQSYLDSASAHAFAADFGALYRQAHSPLSLGMSLVNLGTDLKYIDAHEPLPLGLHVGAAYRFLEERLIVAAQYDDWFRNKRSYGDLGVEYRPVPLVGIRLGYQLGRGADQLGSGLAGFSTGIGFQFKRFNLDYAFLPYGDLGTTQRFSIGLRFGDGAERESTMKSAL